MSGMLKCYKFNSDLSKLDVSKVEDKSGMFEGWYKIQTNNIANF